MDFAQVSDKEWEWLVGAIALVYFGVIPHFILVQRIRLAITKGWVSEDLAHEARIIMFTAGVILIITLISVAGSIYAYRTDKAFQAWLWIILIMGYPLRWPEGGAPEFLCCP